MTRSNLNWNRIHKGRNLWSKANYFPKYYLGELQPHVMTMSLSKGAFLDQVAIFCDLCTRESIYMIYYSLTFYKEWQPRRDTQMLSVINVKKTWDSLSGSETGMVRGVQMGDGGGYELRPLSDLKS